MGRVAGNFYLPERIFTCHGHRANGLIRRLVCPGAMCLSNADTSEMLEVLKDCGVRRRPGLSKAFLNPYKYALNSL